MGIARDEWDGSLLEPDEAHRRSLERRADDEALDDPDDDYRRARYGITRAGRDALEDDADEDHRRDE
jgi:hypothetical protein